MKISQEIWGSRSKSKGGYYPSYAKETQMAKKKKAKKRKKK